MRARHILIKANKGDSVSEAEALKKITEIAGKTTPENFADMAAKYSEDSTKTKQGDLGFFKRGQMVPEFEKAAFSLAPQKVSSVVKTDFGYHLIKVEAKKEGSETSYEEAKNIIAKTLLQKEKTMAISQDLEELLAKKDIKGVEEKLKNLGVKWQESAEFSLDSAQIPGMGGSEGTVDMALRLNKESPIAEKLVRQAGSSYVLRHKSISNSVSAKKDDDSDKWLAQSRAQSAIGEWTKRLRDGAKIAYNDRYYSDNEAGELSE